MTKSDDGLWPILKAKATGPHWQRLESALTAGGIPDVNGCWQGVEIWCELKSVRSGIKISSFTSLQAGWLLKRRAAGGRTWMLLRHRIDGGPRVGPAFDRLLVFPGSWSRELMEHGLRVKPYVYMDIHTDQSAGWDLLLEYLFRRPYPEAGPKIAV